MKPENAFRHLAGAMDGGLILSALLIGFDHGGRDIFTDMGENAVMFSVGASYLLVRPMVALMILSSKKNK